MEIDTSLCYVCLGCATGVIKADSYTPSESTHIGSAHLKMLCQPVDGEWHFLGACEPGSVSQESTGNLRRYHS